MAETTIFLIRCQNSPVFHIDTCHVAGRTAVKWKWATGMTIKEVLRNVRQTRGLPRPAKCCLQDMWDCENQRIR